MSIAPLDWVVLIAYLIIITAIGLIVGYRVRESEFQRFIAAREGNAAA